MLETNHKCNSDKRSKAGRKARFLVNGEEPKYSNTAVVYGSCTGVWVLQVNRVRDLRFHDCSSLAS